MPRIAIDYSQTIIYQIKCIDENINFIYVGHTTNKQERLKNHKTRCNNFNDKSYNFKLYQTIRENGGWENWEMNVLEQYSCENKIQAELKEREWILKLNAKLNMKLPVQSKKEYYENNKEIISAIQKEKYATLSIEQKQNRYEKTKMRRELNPDERKIYDKKYNNKEEVKIRLKLYYESNKEKISQQKKEWYEKQKLLN
jgi:hypothetical protein